MKKILIIIVISIAILAVLFFVAQRITKKVGKDINTFYKPYQNKGLFLKDIDFLDGEYALYIKHKAFGEFIVSDKKGLAENKTNLDIKLSFINYLPGEGDRGYGAILFKNNKQIKSKTGGVFSVFEIGTLKDYSVPAKKERIRELHPNFRTGT